MSFDKVTQEPPRPYDNDDDPCPRCRRNDRVLYDPEYDYWVCTRCTASWPVDPRDPRVQ